MAYEWKETLKAEVHFLGSQFSEQMRNELDEVYRKAEAFDQIIEISEECDNYMDFGDEIDAVIRSYKEGK